MNVLVFIVFVLAAIGEIRIVKAASIREDGCAVSINYANGDLKEPQPLLLKKEKNETSFLNPIDKRGTVKLKSGENVLIACPGQDNYIQGIKGSKNVDEINAICLHGKTFSFGSTRFNFTTLACKFLPTHVARRTRKDNCYDNAVHVEIGFALKKEFLRTIEICRDSETMMTHWTKFRLSSSIASFQSGFPRPWKWESGDFYETYNIGNLYQSNVQARTIGKLVNSVELGNKYIDGNKNRYMARGHLTAKADFVYGSAQSSTFWYLNAAPQWQTFNSGNWNTLEINVRQYAATRTSDLDVYTGTYGQMSLADINGNDVPIYLYVNGTAKEFPVPKFFWKIIYDPLTKKGTSFVGSNDPWVENITDDMFICNDISDKIQWLKWKPRSIVKGISYVCDINDLRKTIPYIPLLKVNDILT